MYVSRKNRQVFYKWQFNDGFVYLFSSQVLYDDLYYIANQGTLSTIAGGDRVDKIIINNWANLLNASELNTNFSYVLGSLYKRITCKLIEENTFSDILHKHLCFL